MAPPLKRTPPPPIPTRQELALNQTRMDKRDRAKLKLDIFQGEVTRRALSWSIAARKVGEAYKIADNMYKQTLQKKAASDAVEIQIFFSVLTVATSGALGWMSFAAAKATGGVESALRDSVETSVQATAGEVFSANGPLLFPPRGDDTVSEDPQVFQDELQNKVDSVHMDVIAAFGKIRQAYLARNLQSWDKYNEAEEIVVHQQWMKEADQLAGKDDLPSVNWMAEELERGRWAKYVLENHSYRDFGVFQTADTPDYVGSDVNERLLKLGVLAAQMNWGGGKTATERLGLGKELQGQELCRRKEAPDFRQRRQVSLIQGSGSTLDPRLIPPRWWRIDRP